MRILFAPDWREGNDYQLLLANALERQGVKVDFLTINSFLMPISRKIRNYTNLDIFHLHWPEGYYMFGKFWEFAFRSLQFPFDLLLATRGLPLVYTAHDLYPLHRKIDFFVRFPTNFVFKHSSAIFVHSKASKNLIASIFGVNEKNIFVIPHGDLAESCSLSVTRDEARIKLGITEKPICLVFGIVKPYKGIEEIIEFWLKRQPKAVLAIVGKPYTQEYKIKLERLSKGSSSISLNLEWQSSEQLKLWLSAADCTIFNYKNILTSGSACLARSLGLPIVIPKRLSTIDLDEPHSLVFRFNTLDSDFESVLNSAINIRPNFSLAQEWRNLTSWDLVAKATIDVYENVLEKSSKA